MAAADDYDVAAALAEFHESRGGVRGLVESGITTVPRLFLAPDVESATRETGYMAVPSVDLSLPRSDAVALVSAAARSCGIFYVTNHGIPVGTIDAALFAVRAFHELPLPERSEFYTLAPVGAVAYSTSPLPPNFVPYLPWRDTLNVCFGLSEPELWSVPAVCRDALQEYQRSLTVFGKAMAGLLSEALGVGAERLEQAVQLEGWMTACHYYPPCPEPAGVVAGQRHTDTSLFTVLAQDGVGGLQVWQQEGDNNHGAGGEWLNVMPVAGAVLINIGKMLKVVSNEEFKSVEHKVVIKSTKEARVSIAALFCPAKPDSGEAHTLQALPELVTAERPARYETLTIPEYMNVRRESGGHDRPSTERFGISKT